MVLMCGLELTFFAAVMLALTPASTSAAVKEAPPGAAAESAVTAVGLVAASAFLMASGVARARELRRLPQRSAYGLLTWLGGLRQSIVRLFNGSKHPWPRHVI